MVLQVSRLTGRRFLQRAHALVCKNLPPVTCQPATVLRATALT
jgi:hypothetical protein